MSIANKKIAVLFPGQGSQFVGMGGDFLAAGTQAQGLMDMAGKVSGFPVRKLCLEGPLTELTKTIYLQPALTAVNLICWNAVREAGIIPDFVAGHSLGEYSALCAAGVLTPTDTLALVTERGRIMEREGRRQPGGMRAVLGLTLEEVLEVLAAVSSAGVVVAANHNSEKQVVISGEFTALDAAAELVRQRGGKIIALNVSIANHSPLVAGAVPEFEAVMAGIDFRRPTIPLFFNATAGEESDPEAIRGIMARQVASQVRWYEIIKVLMSRDVQVFIEVGPKAVLTGLLKKILPKGYAHQKFQIDSPGALSRCLAEIDCSTF